MSQSEGLSQRIAQLRDYAAGFWPGRITVQEPESDGVDLLIQMETGFAFFRVVPAGESVADLWYRAQVQIARFRDRHFQEGRLPDLYLVLLSEGALDPQDLTIQAIARDPYICRKVILELGERSPKELFSQLPFWPLTLSSAQVEPIPPVPDAMCALGYSREWVEELIGNNSGLALARRLISGELQLHPGTAEAAEAAMVLAKGPGGAPALNRRRLKSLQIDGFRGYARSQPFDLNANLIVLYAPNGTGKTSFCEAIEWALTGAIDRLRKPGPDSPTDVASALLNLEQERALVRAELTGLAEAIQIELRKGEAKPQWLVPGAVGEAERSKIVAALGARVPDRRSADWIRGAFQRYHYLEQGTQFDFLRRTKPEERYELYQVLVGTADYALADDRIGDTLRELSREVDRREPEIKRLEEQAQLGEERALKLRGLVDEQIRHLAGKDPAQLIGATAQAVAELGLLAEAARSTDGAMVAALLKRQLPAVIEAAAQRLKGLGTLPHQLRERAERRDRRASFQRQRSDLADEKVRAKEALQGHQAQIAALQDGIERLTGAAARERERIRRLERWLELSPGLQQAETALEQMQKAAEAAETAHRTAAGELAGLRRRLETEQGELAERESAFLGEQRRLKGLEAVREAVRLWLALQAEGEQVGVQLRETAAEERRLQGEAAGLGDSLKRQEEAVRQLQERVSGLRATLSERNELVVRLQAHIHSGDCPLCGTLFDDREALLRAVKASLKAVPTEIQEAESGLQRQQEDSGKERLRLQGLQDQLRGVADRRKALEDRQQELLHQQAAPAAEVEGEFPGGGVGPSLLAALEERMEPVRRALAKAQAAHETTRERADGLQSEIFLKESAVVSLTERREVAAQQLSRAQQGRDRLVAEANGLGLTPQERLYPGGELGAARAALASAEGQLETSGVALTEARKGRDEQELRLQRLAETEQAILLHLSQLAQADSALAQELKLLGLPEESDEAAVSAAYTETERRYQALEGLLAQLPLLEVAVQLTEAQQSLGQVETDLGRTKAEVDRKRAELKQIERLRSGCERFRADLSATSTRLEMERGTEYLPLVRTIYQRLSLHPYFGDLELKVDSEAKEFSVRVLHPGNRMPVGGVSDFFSMAQMNVVLLSIFLAQALLQGWSSLGSIILDDPVQHMDDMNAYALLDLLQSLALVDQQVLVTTSNRQLYKLMLVKFATLNRDGKERFKAYRLQGIGRKAPEVIPDTDLIRE